MRWTGFVIVVVSAAIAYACGSDSGAKKDAAIDTKTVSPDAPFDAHVDAPPDGPAGTIALTVKNYVQWCTVKVGSGGAFTPAAAQVVFVLPGAISLTAKA